MSPVYVNPVAQPPKYSDILEIVVLKALLLVLTPLVPLRSMLWLIDRAPKKRKPHLATLVRKVSLVQGIKDTRKFHRVVRLNCLKRSLITLYLMNRHGVPAKFHLGVNPNQGKFAHAWVSTSQTQLAPIFAGPAMLGLYAVVFSHGNH